MKIKNVIELKEIQNEELQTRIYELTILSYLNKDLTSCNYFRDKDNSEIVMINNNSNNWESEEDNDNNEWDSETASENDSENDEDDL